MDNLSVYALAIAMKFTLCVYLAITHIKTGACWHCLDSVTSGGYPVTTVIGGA